MLKNYFKCIQGGWVNEYKNSWNRKKYFNILIQLQGNLRFKINNCRKHEIFMARNQIIFNMYLKKSFKTNAL